MSYLDRNSANRSNRTIVLATVAGIHALALYGLMTGLGGQYVDQVVTTITGSNIPIAPPPPPTTEPPKKVEPTDTRVTVTRDPIGLPPMTDRPLMEPTVMVLPPMPGPTRPDFVQLPELKIIPSPTPTGTPKLARPRNAPANWVTTNDYPTTELRNGVQGAVGFEVAIGTDGSVERCRITSSSGSAGLDAATCRYVTRRARFEPATDASGAKVNGTYSSKVTWVIPKD